MSTPTPAPGADTHTREAWLEKAIAVYFRPLFEQIGYKIPELVHVSVGWGYGRASAESKIILGQCWSGVASEDSAPHIFVSPMVSDPAEVLAIIAHELIHATLDPDMSHGKEFKTLADAVGLTGPMTETTADISTSAEYMLMAEEGGELGPYPHSALSVFEFAKNPAKVPEYVGGPTPRRKVTSGPAPQRARWLRVRCADHPSGGSVMTSRSTVDRGAAPMCGESIDDLGTPCGNRMTLPE